MGARPPGFMIPGLNLQQFEMCMLPACSSRISWCSSSGLDEQPPGTSQLGLGDRSGPAVPSHPAPSTGGSMGPIKESGKGGGGS